MTVQNKTSFLKSSQALYPWSSHHPPHSKTYRHNFLHRKHSKWMSKLLEMLVFICSHGPKMTLCQGTGGGSREQPSEILRNCWNLFCLSSNSIQFCIKIKCHILHFTSVLCHHEYHSQRESTRILENPGLKQSSFHTVYTICSGLKHSIMKYKEITLNRHLQMSHALYRSGKRPKDKKVLISWCGLASIGKKKKKFPNIVKLFQKLSLHPPTSKLHHCNSHPSY